MNSGMHSFTRRQVNTQLERILASPNFRHASVLSRFLKHIVIETLEGRGHELKEYTIAVTALMKESDFNPQIDSIVRIHAGRLRRALREYYQSEGLHDPIVIIVPKGSYVPIFEEYAGGPVVTHDHAPPLFPAAGPAMHADFKNTPSRHARKDRKPSLQVAPIKMVINRDVEVRSSLTEYLSTELTKFDDLAVIYANSDASVPVADYVIRGSVHLAGQRARVFIQLQDRAGRQHWGQTIDTSFEDMWKMEDEVVTRAVASIAGINGVIARVESQFIQDHSEGKEAQWQLSYWYRQHITHFDVLKTKTARHYYEEVLIEEPGNALAAAYLSEVICRDAYFGKEKDKPALLLQSLSHAREALLIDPNCQQAYHALANISMVLGKTDECLRAIEKGLSINPRCVDFLGGAGAILIYLGHYEKGYALMERALPLAPDSPWSHLVALALHDFHKGSFREALVWLDQVKVETIWVLLLRASAAVYEKSYDLACAAMSEFRVKYPHLNPCEKRTVDELFVLPELSSSVHTALIQLIETPLYVSERKASRLSKKATS